MEINTTLIITIVINVFIILIAFYMLFLYLKSKTFYSYECSNMLIINFVLLFDNVLRLFSINNEKLQFTQAFILVFLDKLLLTAITMQAIINYFGIVKYKFYQKHKKRIFYTTLIISLLLCIILSMILIITQGKIKYDVTLYYYCNSVNNIKKIIDISLNCIYICINLFCIIITIITLSENKKDAEYHDIIDDVDYKYHLIKEIIMLFVNILAFVESFLIIYDVLYSLGLNVDLVYLITCLVIDLYYTVNKTTFEETLKLCCKKKYSNNLSKSFSVNDDDSEDSLQRTDSFYEK